MKRKLPLESVRPGRRFPVRRLRSIIEAPFKGSSLSPSTATTAPLISPVVTSCAAPEDVRTDATNNVKAAARAVLDFMLWNIRTCLTVRHTHHIVVPLVASKIPGRKRACLIDQIFGRHVMTSNRGAVHDVEIAAVLAEGSTNRHHLIWNLYCVSRHT